MTRLFCYLFFISTLFIFVGCQEQTPMAPELNQSDQSITAVAKKVKTVFTGTSNFVQPHSDGTVTELPNGMTLIQNRIREWYDTASDLRATGTSMWVVNQLVDENGDGRLWGTAEIFVDNEACNGKWQLKWWGTIDAEGLLAKAVGTGTEGDVKGLEAKWTYTMVFAQGFYYAIDGSIIERNLLYTTQ